MDGSRTAMPRAVVLLSGGLDSATVLAIARSRGFDCYALSIDYRQRHRVELDAAVRVARALGATRHVIADVDLSRIGGSALTDMSIAVPDAEQSRMEAIPVTYVPARNTIMMSVALGWAEVLGAGDIFFGANAVDYSGYPDCRPEYVQSFEHMANLATKSAIHGRRLRIQVPIIDMSKAEIIRQGARLGVDFTLTVTCYQPDATGRACGRCDACRIRSEGFATAGLPDPTRYI